MKTYIELERICLYAYHGVAEQETLVGNNYEVYVKVGYPIAKAMESDNVAETLNYANLYQVIKREMQIPSKLLEHVAGRISTRLKREFPAITSLTLKVTKLRPPIVGEVDAASVIITW